MKKSGKTFITGSLPASFYLGDIPSESIPGKGLSKLLLGLAVHFGKKAAPLSPGQTRKNQ